MRALFAASLFALALFFQFSFAQASEPAQKEWTMLVFLNGNNNLDQFGSLNLNQAETVGSTADINVVVQWASLKNKDVRRLLVTKDNDRRKVTSPVIENMGKVDMGDYRNLVEFIKWGVKNFPAKRYFLDIWNHGSGWHDKLRRRGGFGFDDISSDDLSGNSISTEQLGMALRQASAEIGQKIDLYGNDACLMAMAEVAAEVAGGVKVFLGSQDLEPGEGWHYGDFLTLWAAKPAASAHEVSQMLVSSYVASYSGGSNGRQNVTLS
ncbi:MAG TPA: clostripain-related cysteine peptidase, partial [Bdellovibrionota bacterium]|nr:clostripain-related cysteine peptidase [Bdellovibrionota bacterium]